MASKIPAMREISREEVAKHSKQGDLWVIIDSKVYDLSKFAALHPGGLGVLSDPEVAGQDATEIFYSLHRHEVLLKPGYARLQIGTLPGKKPQINANSVGAISKVPFAEPTWLSDGYYSPYYNESHRAFCAELRKFVETEVLPEAQLHEETGKHPSKALLARHAELGLHAMRLGPGKHLKGLTLMNGVVKPEEFDFFHELIATQEFVRIGARGYFDGFLAGMIIGLPPVVNFGKPELREKVVKEVLSGEKVISLAISEAFAGSDVAGLRCTAVKSEDGKYFTVNGTKKWITNAAFSDYFTVGCKTAKGLTVLLIPRGEGVETTPIKTAYSAAAGTAFITFDNVKVPVENVLGREDDGLRVILSNFNHERYGMSASSARSQRMIVEECLKWANQRKVFGKPLISQPVIRNKLAALIARVESVQSWLENIAYQMNNMSYEEQSLKLAGPIGLLKMECTRTAQETARDATQIFGGRAITRTGMGRLIEQYHRTVPFDAILGGGKSSNTTLSNVPISISFILRACAVAEDVLGDLGVRQAIKQMPPNVRL
ncbi:hypothetical protein BOTBODRAFT_144637 [Botryobasidium botryosum FD-172 SS1]|uniref:Cytochrome b5 heme-binding domain-containing protein n=1 Tax=Botryobasidium botryosum (strain FD-172 SS1) TaxID=930990 RepID=A0A067MN95_BOTB1|nr:hypothetical protein BOTBODRAFT_144637 [Botryobasidium botryosum FD-172 SS1]